ncbi:MAG: hypothetical protein ACTSWY_15120 [Promethearchaeota archaeon]
MYILGIFCAIIATICFNFVPILQKEALYQMEEVKFSNVKKSIRNMLTNKKWVFGLFIGLLGAFPYILAMNWVGISVVQPVTNFGMLVLVIFGQKRLGEKLKISGKVSIGLMIIMPFFIILADVSNPQNDITDLWVRNNVFIFTGIILLVIISCFLISKKYPIFLTGVVGSFFALGAYYMQAYTSMLSFSGYDFFQDFDLILSRAFTDPNIVMANLYFLVLLIFNGLAGYTLQIGLQMVAASKFNPIQQTVNNIVTIISGIIIFNQSIGNWIFYLLGIGFASIGTIILGGFQIQYTSDSPNNNGSY